MSNVLITSVKDLMVRDLNKLHHEIDLYSNEELLWKIEGDIKNSAGNLCLHLCGNLQHFIGTVLGKTGYERNRDAEFNTKGLSKESLLKEIKATIASVESTLPKLETAALDQNYPVDVFGKPMSTGYFLVHLTGHLGYHLGQVNYHRRMIK